MAHGEITEVLPANSAVVFDLLHDYKRRLEWDTLLQAAYLEDGHEVAGKGVTSVCVGRPLLGGIALRTVYVTFQPPVLAAVKIVNTPPFFESWAASIHHEDLSADSSRITYKFHFRSKPRFLRSIMEPAMKIMFSWETRKRLQSLRTFLARENGN